MPLCRRALLAGFPGVHGGRSVGRRSRGERDPGRLQGRNLPLGAVVLGEVALDHREVELWQDRRFRLALEQEAKAIPDKLLGGAPASPATEVCARYADEVMSRPCRVRDLDGAPIALAVFSTAD